MFSLLSMCNNFFTSWPAVQCFHCTPSWILLYSKRTFLCYLENALKILIMFSLTKCRQDIKVVVLTNRKKTPPSPKGKQMTQSLQMLYKLMKSKAINSNCYFCWLQLAELPRLSEKKLTVVYPFPYVDVCTPALRSATVLSSRTARTLVHLTAFYLLEAVTLAIKDETGGL